MPRSVLPDAPASGRRRRRRGTSMALAVALTVSGLGVALTGDVRRRRPVLPYQDATLPTATRVADLLGRMTLDEKIGQMTQAERAVVSPSDLTTYRLGSVLSGGGSGPVAEHRRPAGRTCTTASSAARWRRRCRSRCSTASTPCTATTTCSARRSSRTTSASARRATPQLVQDIGRAVAEEVSATGVDWTFAPCLCVARDDRWGRTYESFGEDPAIASSMATIVTGLPGRAARRVPRPCWRRPSTTSPTAARPTGDDQGDARISEAELRAIHLPPFKAAIDSGRRLGDGVVQQLERRQDARQPVPAHGRAQG